LFHSIDKSLGGQRNSPLGNWLEFGDVAVWNNLIFSFGQTVIGGDSNGVGFVSELGEISSVGFGLGESES